jgi:hypothetical protein
MTKKHKTTITVVPALPGYDVVWLDPERSQLYYVPIVAWAVRINIDADISDARPVTVEQTLGVLGYLAIRHQDGSINFPDYKSFARGEEDKALAFAVESVKRKTAWIHSAKK